MKRRENWPFRGANKNAQEFVDMDYVRKLSEKDKEWLANFVEAEYHANREAAERLKGSKLTKSETKRLDKLNNSRRADAHNKLDRSIVAQKALVNSEKVVETQDHSSKEHEE